MATVPVSNAAPYTHPEPYVAEWVGLQQDDDGAWKLLGRHQDKCLHVQGTWGGAAVTIQGSNFDSQEGPVNATDPTQTLISMTADAMKQVLENPLYMRIKVTGGDGTTSLNARLVCRE